MSSESLTTSASFSSQVTANKSVVTNDFILEPSVSKYIRLVLTAIVLFVAVVSNSIVLRIVFSKLPNRKPVIYILIGNLAAAELGQTALQPFLLYYEETWEWIYGDFLCHVMYPLQAVCMANITQTLAGIAVYRYLITVSPIWPTRASTVKMILLLTSFWCVGVAISLPSAVTRKIFPCERQPKKKCCGEVFRDPSAQLKYAVAFDVVVNLVPMFTMVLAYILVGIKIRWHLKTLRRVHNFSDESNARQTTLPLEVRSVNNIKKTIKTRNTEGNIENAGLISEMEKSLMKMMYIIVLSFIVCYLPYEICYHLYQRGILRRWKYGGIVSMYALWLILVPSALHPFLYGTRNKFLRKAFFAFC